MERSDTIRICKVVAQVILSDAEVTDEERALLERLMDRYGLEKAERKDVLDRNLGDDPAAMVEGLSGPEAKAVLLREVAAAVAVDGRFAAAEEGLLGRLGAALGVSAAELEELVGEAVGEAAE